MSICYESEVLVIGSGIAGSIAALELAEKGVEVILVTRASEPSDSNTYYAQGGIVYRGKNDTPDSLIRDINNAGGNHCNPQAVSILAKDGPELVQQLLIEKYGIVFDKTEKGELSLVNEGGHSVARIVHASDATGKVIEIALANAVKNHPKIKLLTRHTAVDLLTPHHHSIDSLAVYEPRSCVGAYALDQDSGQVVRCMAKKTIVATGGLGQIFLRTTNPAGARGDGVAMAYRSGARVINSEFIQFHPTTFFHRNAPLYLISEAVRGAGARLVNADGKPFMQKYEPKWKDLAPRDIVARSIHKEMLLQGVSNVYLDLVSYLPSDKIKKEFPNIYKNCIEYGVDISKDLVPVVPAAHYACGGVWVDEWGVTTIDNCYAVGEIACTGVHGANRLASTSLLEGLVWGKRAADHISQNLKNTPSPDPQNIPPWQDAGLEVPDPALISQDLTYIKNIMWNYVGLIRTTKRLERALRDLRDLENEIEEFYRVTRVTDSLIGLRNVVRTAIIVASAAWENKRSIGCHYRE
ncbi:MAG: L-aspartate oxidase [Calditrichaceae bacterium]